MATRIKNELEEGKGDHPFKKVLFCNIGNPQVLGQKPLTYYRQVLALCEYPQVRPDAECARKAMRQRFRRRSADP
eukprot:361894-Chlamydomonas_euryale.AAC.2